MQGVTIPTSRLEAGDYILTEPMSVPEAGEWSKPNVVCWLIHQIHQSGDVRFITCSGHNQGSNIWFNRPGNIFHFTLSLRDVVTILERRQ